MMRTGIRVAIGLTGIAALLLAIAFYFRWPLVANFWPWGTAYTNIAPLAFYFLSSIAAAVAVPVLWIAITNKLHAAAPGAINLLVAFIGISAFMFQSYADSHNQRVLIGALLMAGVALSSIVIYFLGRGMPVHDMRPLPRMVRYSFYVFIIALIMAGGALVLKIPNTLPWSNTPESMVVYGWIFLGASCYFIFAVLNPRWENAAGQLMGFLAYDVVLLPPLIRHFSDVVPQQRTSLIIYTIVVTYSALLAIYYLFINKPTRLFGSQRPATAPV